MLRAYGPGCDGSIVELKTEKIPDSATWVDLEEPTEEEEGLVERCLRMDVPTEDEMADLEAASGAEFDQMFLTMMIEHHEGAIEMAKTEQSEGEFPEAVDMAKEIETTQAEEIQTMQDLLKS